MTDRHPELRDAALLARRATMRLDLDLVERLASVDWPEALHQVLDVPPDTDPAPATEESNDTVQWWYERITAPGSGLHERMTFFWHTLLTTHRYASGDQALVGPQLDMLRANALGNYRQLLQSFAVDGALIKYLDADASTARRPNENLARELMELFSTGIGHYSEDDVRAAALALTGWRVGNDTNAVSFDPERAHTDPVTFLGETKNWDVTSVVDRLCDHPATAARVGSLVWYHLAGTTPTGDEAAELGAWWQGQDLEIKPLIERIFTSEAFRASHYARPRSGFEYYTALQSITGFDPGDLWRPRNLGQALYEPPNVAGWPVGERWLEPESMLRRSNHLFSFDMADMPGGTTAGTDEILDRCGLHVVSQATLDQITSPPADLDGGSMTQLRWRIALSSPEFQLT